MTLYAGEPAVIDTGGDTVDGVRLSPAEITAATITIWAADGTPLVDEQNMAYDATIVFPKVGSTPAKVGGWRFLWNTIEGAPGAYRARCTLTYAAPGISPNKEFTVVRVRKSKEPDAISAAPYGGY